MPRPAVGRGHSPTSTTDARLVRPDGRNLWASISCSAFAAEAHERPMLVVQVVDSPSESGPNGSSPVPTPTSEASPSSPPQELKCPLQSLTGFVWHAPGRRAFAGDYRGHQGVMEFFGNLTELSGGTFRLEIHDLLASDDHVVALITGAAEREGSERELSGARVWHVANGKATEFWAPQPISTETTSSGPSPGATWTAWPRARSRPRRRP